MEELITRQIKIDRAQADEESRTVTATISTEYPVERFDGFEILEHTETAIDRSREPLPLIVSHDNQMLPVGVVEKIKLVGRELKAVLRFGNSSFAQEVWQDVKAGILQNLSVGYRVLKKTVSGDSYRVTRWELLECSLVAVPADPNSRIGRSLKLKSNKDKTTMNIEMNKIITELEPYAEKRELTAEESEMVHRKMAEFDVLAAGQENPVFFRDLGLKGLIKEMTRTVNGNPADLQPNAAGSISNGDEPEKIETRRGPAVKKTYRAMFPGNPEIDRGGFKSCREFLNSVHSNRFDDRLVRASMGSDVGSDGGFAVPYDFAAAWLDSSLESEIVRPRATVWPMESQTRKVPGWDDYDRSGGSTHGGFSIQWLAQKGTGTRQTGKVEIINLDAKKGAIYVQISNELLADGMDLERQLEAALVSSIGYGLDGVFMHGSGAGQPAGAFSTANPALITASKEAGQIAGTIVYENLTSMFSRMAPACLGRSVWMANNTSLPQLLALSIPIGTGGAHIPVMKENNGQLSILGRPVVFTEHMKTAGTVGDIALCDWSKYAVGMRKEVSIDKSNAPGWTEDMTDYRVIVRVDGMSTWSAPITPKNGDTLSWAVVLETRV